MNRSLFIFILFFVALELDAQFQARQYLVEDEVLNYQFLEPINVEESAEYPLVIFFHGSGERGSDNQAQLKHGSHLFTIVENRERYPAYVVFPQCPEEEYFANVSYTYDQQNVMEAQWEDGFSPVMERVLSLMASLQQQYRIDEERIYVMGLSMGGYATFDLLGKRPEMFAAAIPICGGADPERLSAMIGKPIWIFHGSADPVVPVSESRVVAEYLKQENSNSIRYTEYEGVDHSSWENAFQEKSLLSWLFNQKRR